MPVSAAVVDTTVLSNFAHVEQTRILSQAFEQLVTVQAVWIELQVGITIGRIPPVDWSWLSIVDLEPAVKITADRLARTLGQGESACIALAAANRWIVLTDDRDARRVALAEGVAVSGTIGALVNLIRRKHLTLSDADRYLAVMIEHGYRCPVRSLDELFDPDHL